MDQRKMKEIAEAVATGYKAKSQWHVYLQKQVASKQCTEGHARELLKKWFRELVQTASMSANLPIKKDRIALVNEILAMFPKEAAGEMPWMTGGAQPSELSVVAEIVPMGALQNNHGR